MLFIIAVEGLAGLMRNAISGTIFHPFKFSDDIQFSLLQFADDTMIIGYANRDNIVAVKVLLRGFKLVFRFKGDFLQDLVHRGEY